MFRRSTVLSGAKREPRNSGSCRVIRPPWTRQRVVHNKGMKKNYRHCTTSACIVLFARSCADLVFGKTVAKCCNMLQKSNEKNMISISRSEAKKNTRLSESRDLFFGKHVLGCGVSFVQKTYPKHVGMLSETCCSHSWEILSPNPLPPHPLLPRADVEQVAMIMSQSVCDLGSAKYLWVQHHCEPVAHDSKTLLQNIFQREPE